MDERVGKAIRMAEECLHKGWSAARLAGLVNLSPSRFHQLFKEETGEPPARYLRGLRMRRARELLETTHLSVKQVMAGVGVSDESHFVRDFKKTCGLTPARYRERFLSGGSENGTRPKAGRTASAPARVGPPPVQTTAPPSSVPASASPPLLLRRASHPRQLSEAPRASRRRELLSLLKRRHASFAELTAAATDRIVREMPGDRHIAYRPRRSAGARRLPPLAERPPEPLRAHDAARRRG
ncbi:MAG TPA: helix-turn-helix domain-containing protein [Pyrinomonadaceae bacterium]